MEIDWLYKLQDIIAQMGMDEWREIIRLMCLCLKWHLEVKGERKRPPKKRNISNPDDQM